MQKHVFIHVNLTAVFSLSFKIKDNLFHDLQSHWLPILNQAAETIPIVLQIIINVVAYTHTLTDNVLFEFMAGEDNIVILWKRVILMTNYYKHPLRTCTKSTPDTHRYIIPSFTLAQLLRSATWEKPCVNQMQCSPFFLMKTNSTDAFIAVTVHVYFSSSFVILVIFS